MLSCPLSSQTFEFGVNLIKEETKVQRILSIAKNLSQCFVSTDFTDYNTATF